MSGEATHQHYANSALDRCAFLEKKNVTLPLRPSSSSRTFCTDSPQLSPADAADAEFEVGGGSPSVAMFDLKLILLKKYASKSHHTAFSICLGRNSVPKVRAIPGSTFQVLQKVFGRGEY